MMFLIVQWHNGAGVGVRSTRLYNITKIHLTTTGVKTLCGRRIPRASQHLVPGEEDPYCAVCEKVRDRMRREL